MWKMFTWFSTMLIYFFLKPCLRWRISGKHLTWCILSNDIFWAWKRWLRQAVIVNLENKNWDPTDQQRLPRQALVLKPSLRQRNESGCAQGATLDAWSVVNLHTTHPDFFSLPLFKSIYSNQMAKWMQQNIPLLKCTFFWLPPYSLHGHERQRLLFPISYYSSGLFVWRPHW